MERTYSIIYTGSILNGFESDQVIEKFKSLTNLDQESARKFILNSKKVYVRKNLTKDKALKYKDKLSQIGLEIIITKSAKISKKINNSQPDSSITNEVSNATTASDQENPERQEELVSLKTKAGEYFSKATSRILLSLIIAAMIAVFGGFTHTLTKSFIFIVVVAAIVYGYLSVLLIQNRNKLIKSLLIMACCYILAVFAVLMTGGWLSIGLDVAIVTTSAVAVLCKNQYIDS